MGRLHIQVYIEKNTALSAAILRNVVTYWAKRGLYFFYTSNMQLYSGPIIKCKGPYHLFTVAPSSYTTISLAKIRNTLTTYSNIVDSSSFNRFAWLTALDPGS